MDRSEYLLSAMRGQRNQAYEENVQLLINKIAYDDSGNPIYYALAFQGSATSAAKWRIEKLAYDSNGQYTGSTFSQPNQVWDDRATSVTYS